MLLWLWFKSVARHWWSLMSCAVFTLIGLYVAYTHQSSEWVVRATISAAALCLLLGCFFSWKDEHLRLQSEQLENRMPKIRGEVKQIFWEVAKHPVTKKDEPKDTHFYAFLGLVNYADVQCTVRDFRMHILQENGISKASDSYDFGISGVIEHTNDYMDGQTKKFPEGPAKTEVAPIPALRGQPLIKGCEQSGWFQFYVRGYVPKPDDWGAFREQLHFQFRDSFRETHEITDKGKFWIFKGHLTERKN